MRSFKVDLGLGDQHYRPYDAAGPVTVNLANGNLFASITSPSFSIVGGTIGLSYSYNSQQPSSQGLTGHYFIDDGDHNFESHEHPVLIRTDSRPNFNWGGRAPHPSLPKDDFMVRWSGYVTVPNTSSFKFGTKADDGTKLWVNGNLVLSNWVNQEETLKLGTALSLTAGQTVPVVLEYYDDADKAVARLWVEGPTGSGGALGSIPVPASWLTTNVPGLPDGWSLSVDPDGNIGYSYARVSEQTVVLVDSSGATHSYNWTGSSWAPPKGERGVLGTDPDSGLLTLHGEDGQSYSFNKDGTLAEVVSALDDTQPAVPRYTWEGTPPKLTRITDPVSSRSVVLTYGGPECPSPPSGFTPAPSHMICKSDYSAFGGGETASTTRTATWPASRIPEERSPTSATTPLLA